MQTKGHNVNYCSKKWKNFFNKEASTTVLRTYGENVIAAYRKKQNTQNFQLRDNKSQWLIMTKNLITSCTLKWQTMKTQLTNQFSEILKPKFFSLPDFWSFQYFWKVFSCLWVATKIILSEYWISSSENWTFCCWFVGRIFRSNISHQGPESIVCIATGHRLDDQGVKVWVPAG
jgi:hypothetical protein